MKKTIFNRLITIGVCAAFSVAALAASVPGQSEEKDSPKVTILPVRDVATGEKIPAAGATMSRQSKAVFFSLYTQGLTPGYAVTAWMAVFNNPENCATRPCTPADFANPAVNGTLLNTGGRIIGADGAATYGAFRAVGDVTGARPGVGTGNGLVDTKRAEIHIVVRSHGPALLGDPAALAEQLNLFFGGCPPNTCVNLQTSVFAP